MDTRARKLPTGDEARRVWLVGALAKYTRTIKHAGNLKYARTFSKTVKLSSLTYPKIKTI